MPRRMAILLAELGIPVILAGTLAVVVVGIPRLVGTEGRSILAAVPLSALTLGLGGYLSYRMSRRAGALRKK